MHRLSWSLNGDSLDVAVAANRLAAAGCDVWRCLEPCGPLEAGDYLAELDGKLAARLHAAGVSVEVWDQPRPSNAEVVRPARVAVLGGKASAYPYYGYYAFALARLGYAYVHVDGADIAAGAIERENLLVLPGGFSNWGIDAKEETSGADRAVRRFLTEGGAAVVSCGGAYYLSRGRPAWLGVADARPIFTQEYLRTGVGIVTCQLAPGRHRLGLPPTLEIPYYHGPVYDELGTGCTSLATFRDRYGHGRLFIDNPLSEETFRRHMQDRTAVLRASGSRGEAMLFSPHPEMGELLRKYMALETYVPRYLPVRGEQVMRETLDSYRPHESRSFLMILNAVEELLQSARTAELDGYEPAGSVNAAGLLPQLEDAWLRRSVDLKPSSGGMGDLERHILDGLKKRLDPTARVLQQELPRLARTGKDGPRLSSSFWAIAAHAVEAWSDPPERRPAELLLELELALLLLEAWVRLSAIDLAVCADA